MSPQELLLICVSAFLAVFVLLALLSALMRILALVFPATETAEDTTVYAAITAAYRHQYPDMIITNIKEIP